MPVTKTRARSMANGGQELRARTQEEVNVEIMALRKEVAHAKDENTLLKGRLRKIEEDSAKKAKHFEKQLAAAKRESLASEKRKESDVVTMLRQKCARLEQTLKEKDISLKRIQQEKTQLKARETKSATDLKDLHNTRSSLDSKRIPPKSVPRANSVPTAELTRLKDSVRKLQQDNSSLQLQLKERDQEIKQLKMQLLKAQRPPTAPRRSLKVPEVKPNNSRNTTQDSVSNKTKVVEPKIVKEKVVNGDCLPCEERARMLQKNIAAKRIQRGWREHRGRVVEVVNIHHVHETTNGIADEQDSEATVLLQSVMRGHMDRLDYINKIQEKLEEEDCNLQKEE